MKRISFLTCSVFILISMSVKAQVELRTEYFGRSDYYHELGDDKREKVGDCKGSAMVYRGSINIPLSVKNTKYDRPSIWGVGISGAYASLTNQNFDGQYKGMVIDEMLNGTFGIVHVRPIGEKLNLMASLGIGLYAPTTDFSKLRYKHLMGNAAALLVWRIKPNLELGGGVAINNSFGYPMIFPALYFNWDYVGKLNLKVSAVDGLEVSAGYHINKFLDLSLIVEMSGQSAFLEKDGKDVIFSHQYFITGLRPEIKLGKHVSIPITAGMNIMRSGYLSDRTLKGMFSYDDYYFQASPYASVGLKIGF